MLFQCALSAMIWTAGRYAFANLFVEYIVHSGMMKELSALQESPLTDQVSMAEIFTDLSVGMGIRKIIESIADYTIVA